MGRNVGPSASRARPYRMLMKALGEAITLAARAKGMTHNAYIAMMRRWA